MDVVHHPHQQQEQQPERDEVNQHLEQQGLLGDLGVPTVRDRRIAQRLGDLVSALLGVLGEHLGAVDTRDRMVQRQPQPLFFVLDRRLLDVVRRELLQRL